jgi:hypothetical protein
MTTTVNDARLAAATVPYALSGLAWHLLDYRLPTPDQIEIRDGRLTLFILAQDVTAWSITADLAAETVQTRTDRAFGTGPFDVHRADAVLHGAGVKATICWTTPSDAIVCESLDDTCTNVVGDLASDEPGCAHGNALCSHHRMECQHCREDLADDRPLGFDGQVGR